MLLLLTFSAVVHNPKNNNDNNITDYQPISVPRPVVNVIPKPCWPQSVVTVT